MFLRSAMSQKAGQPEPESYLVSEAKSSAPQATQAYMPAALWSKYLFLKGCSVPFITQTLYCSGVSFFLSSSGVGAALAEAASRGGAGTGAWTGAGSREQAPRRAQRAIDRALIGRSSIPFNPGQADPIPGRRPRF